MKIAIYSGAIPSTTFIEHLIEGVSKHHQVLLFGTLNKKKFRPYHNPNIVLHYNEKNKFKGFFQTLFRFIRLLFQHPRRLKPLFKELSNYSGVYNKRMYFSKYLPMILYKPDILHIQWAKDIEFYAFLKDAYDIKIVLSLLGSHINYSPIASAHLASVYRKRFPQIDAFHAVSEAIKLEAQKYGAPSEKIVVIRSPIPDLFFKSYRPFQKDYNQAVIKLVSVGRFHWVKGINYSLDAISILKQRGYQIEYTIVGVQEPSEEILYKIHNLGLQNNIQLISSIAQAQLIKLLHKKHILILPSIMEGLANVVLEAMAIGLPVISTDCGGMREVVNTGETGWLVPKRSAISIADAVENINASSEDEIQCITQNAHAVVKQFYSAHNSVAEFVQLYQEVLNTKF